MLVDRRTGPVFEPGLARTLAKFEISNNSAVNLLNNKIKVFQPDKNTNVDIYVFIVKIGLLQIQWDYVLILTYRLGFEELKIKLALGNMVLLCVGCLFVVLTWLKP